MNQLRKFFRGFVMAQPQCKSARRVQRGRSGMTLIELLVAVSILAIIAAILVPQLRFASADRNIREASRMVASLFAEASQRASNEGVSGVVIERNPNIVDEITGVAYAGTSLFILREIPPYIGEGTSDDVAEYAQRSTADFPDAPDHAPFDPESPSDPFDIWIPEPLEEGIVQAGDQISFNGQPLRFNIDSVLAETHISDNTKNVLRLQLSSPFDFVAGNIREPRIRVAPNSPNTNTRAEIGSFIVHRQPRKLVSSRVDMPTGYLVDLRLSGELFNGNTFFSLDTRPIVDPLVNPTLNSVAYLFNGRGSIDRFVFTDATGTRRGGLPREPAYLMVREYNPDDGGEMIENVLRSERQMWVTIDQTTGAANVISGLGVDTSVFTTLPQSLERARQLGSQGQAAQ